jgi:hypothetical protein
MRCSATHSWSARSRSGTGWFACPPVVSFAQSRRVLCCQRRNLASSRLCQQPGRKRVDALEEQWLPTIRLLG